MKVSITEEDIKNGKRNEPAECPLALALKRASNKPCQVWPSWKGQGLIYFDIGEHNVVRVPIFAALNRMLLAYDAGSEMEPIEFEMNI